MSKPLAESSSSDNDSYRMMSESDSSSDENDDNKPGSSWRDREALQPFTANESSKVGFSTLCSACHAFFGGKREEDTKYKHIRFLTTLRNTASRGCSLCTLLRAAVDRETANHYPATTLNLYLAIAGPDSKSSDAFKIWYYYRKGSKRPKYGSFVQGIKCINLVALRGQYSKR